MAKQATESDWTRVRAERDALPDSSPKQALLSMQDREYFAREFIRDSGSIPEALLRTLSMTAAVPSEQAAKQLVQALGLSDTSLGQRVLGRSGRLPTEDQPPALASIGAGYQGTLNGLVDYLQTVVPQQFNYYASK